MATRDYDRVAQAIAYLDAHQLEQPQLEDVAAALGLSPYHFQRLFRRWAGVSPKRFLQFLTLQHAKSLLERPTELLEVAYEAGLSGPGRLHDLFVAADGVTPGEYRRRGEGITLRYGFQATPFGECLVAVSARGICALEFRDATASPRDQLERLERRWSAAELVEQPSATRDIVESIFRPRARKHLLLHLRGTNFQLKVWEALLRIPEGKLVSYGTIAAGLGKPGAVRAVAGAVGANPVALLIPCHRVIKSTGHFGDYRWGGERKRALIGFECARIHGEGEGRATA